MYCGKLDNKFKWFSLADLTFFPLFCLMLGVDMPKKFLLAQSKDGKDRQTAPIKAFLIIPSTHTL
jgi:hypothetical protein